MSNASEASNIPRQCGSCYACCIYLGIEELNKRPSVTCTHLDGSLGPETRCSIYKTRPHACSRYKCAYLNGFGNDQDRPDKTGLLITSYLDPDKPQADLTTFLTTICITNTHLSQYPNLSEGTPINNAIKQITQFSTGDIRIVNYFRKEVIYLHGGKIYKGKLILTKEIETLTFEVKQPPIGTYHSEPLT